MDESIVEHLKLAANSGLSRGEIKRMLLSSGWPQSFVDKYLEKSYKVLPKNSMLQVHGLSKAFGQNQVLEGVNFELYRGEIFGLIGVSGTGKTTLLNLLVGFLSPNQGDVLIGLPNGSTKSTVRNPQLIKQHVGFSTQLPSFYHKLTVRENILHFANLYGLNYNAARRRANALTELVGLQSSRDVIASNLSGGMQKRLDIACALIHDPALLILDEPTSDLDPVMRKQLWRLIKKISAKGTTVLLASHFLAEIELLCDRIAILHKKRIVEIGSADELREIYAKNFELYLQTKDANYDVFAKAINHKGVKSFVDGAELVINTPTPMKTLQQVVAKLKDHELQSLHISRPTLGRVFETVVKR